MKHLVMKTLGGSRLLRLPKVTFSTQKANRLSTTNETENNTFYVTTPIYYVNADPHIGHLYTSVIADTISRWQHILNKGAKIKFSTGTDEHGTKIQQAAAAHNSTPLEYCNKISTVYKNLAENFDINYTDFIRTTDELHLETVEKFWNVLVKNGHIYSSNYSGWYCVSDETFLGPSLLKEIVGTNGEKLLVSEESGHPVEWTEEKNYLFRLSSFQDDLIYWLKNNEDAVKPKKFYKILLDSVSKDPLPDVSVSRPSSRVSWGIPVPSDPSQTIYVWLDALVYYLTAAKYLNDDRIFRSIWPPDVQVIGKDILKFHGIYWPAFLLAANLEPPKSLLCHSHWTVASEKMSKSKKNVVDPFERSHVYTSDGMRYFLLRVGVAQSDGNYNDTKVIRTLNSELADTLGNLLNRCTGSALNPDQEFPKVDPDALETLMEGDIAKKLVDSVYDLPEICERHYSEHNFYKVVDAVIATLHCGNLFFESMKPWELKKNPDDYELLNAVLHVTIETLRVAGILLQPIIPNLSGTLLERLNIEEDNRYFKDLETFSWNDPDFCTRRLSPDKVVLFRRILLENKVKVVIK